MSERSTSYDWHNQMANTHVKKQDFVWANQTIKTRRELAQYNKIRVKNVSVFQVIMITIRRYFQGF